MTEISSEEVQDISDKAKTILRVIDHLESWEVGVTLSVVLTWWLKTKTKDQRALFMEKLTQSVMRPRTLQ